MFVTQGGSEIATWILSVFLQCLVISVLLGVLLGLGWASGPVPIWLLGY